MKPTNMPKRKVSGKTVKRLLSIIMGGYKLPFIAVSICIIVSAIANVAGSAFIRILIDDYITPLLSTPNPVFTGPFAGHSDYGYGLCHRNCCNSYV